MSLSNSIRQRIVNLATTNQFSIRELSLRAGIPPSTINTFLEGKSGSVTMTTLLHICDDATNISLKDFFDDPLFEKKFKNKIDLKETSSNDDNSTLLSNAIRTRIINLAKYNKIKSLKKLSEKSNVYYSTLRNFMSDSVKTINSNTLYAICCGLNIDIVDFFDSPLFVNLIDEHERESVN